MGITLDHVKRYIQLGFVVHPCCPADHFCASPGKIPFDPIAAKHMEGWQEHEQFSYRRWEEWVDYDSSINIGALCGSPSRLLFIDVDNKGAEDEFRRLQNGRQKGYWIFRTGKGSRYCFRHREGNGPARSAKLLTRSGDYLEILGDGRQSVLPPSLHPSGRRYRWVEGRTPRDFEPDAAPRWAVECRGSGSGEGISSETRLWKELISNVTSEGSRNETLTQLCGHLLAPQPLPPDEVRLWLEAYNRAFCKPPLPEEEVNRLFNSIVQREEASEGMIRKVMEKYDVPRDTAIEYILQDPEIAND